MGVLNARLFVSLAVATIGAAGACQSFSGGDDEPTDAGGADTSTTAVPEGAVAEGAVPDASVTDATTDDGSTPCSSDAGLLYCDSFEEPGTSCGLAWKVMNGSGERVSGAAHSGAQFCRFCANAKLAALMQSFSFAAQTSYVLSAWVRLAAHPDAAAPATMTGQLILYGDGGAQLGRNDQSAMLSLSQWQHIQSALTDASAVVREDVLFYPEPYADAVGDCIDIDDVTISPQ